MFNLISAMTFNKDALFKALEITWKGMLAILIVILVVMLVTYLMQFPANGRQEKKSRNLPRKMPTTETNGRHDERQA